MKKIFILVLLLISAPALRAEDYGYCEEGVLVKKINITTKRVKESVIRGRFKIKEGDVLNPDIMRRAAEDLNDMKIFKMLKIEAVRTAEKEADINIEGEDSYFVLPLPLYSGGDKNVFMLMLMEANLFKRGEAAAVFGAHSDDGDMAGASVSMARSGVNFLYSDASYTEKQYANGMYGMTGILSADKTEDSWGAPAFERETDKKSFGLGYSFMFNKYNSASIGFKRQNTKYDGEEQKANTISIGFSTHKNQRSSRGIAGGSGALFGMGLADKHTFLQQLDKTRYGYSVNLEYEAAGSMTGSDYDLNTFSASASGTAEFKNRNALAFIMRGAYSPQGPDYEKTGSAKNLLPGFGDYSREYRGKGGAGIGAGYTHYLSRTGTGLLALTPFVEGAVVYAGGHSRSQGGAGAGLSYKFWRFPFSIGFKYTKNLTDGSYLFSFTAGGF